MMEESSASCDADLALHQNMPVLFDYILGKRDRHAASVVLEGCNVNVLL